MKMNNYQENSLISLFAPKKEGLGTYDFHYINTYSKINKAKLKTEHNNERHAA